MCGAAEEAARHVRPDRAVPETPPPPASLLASLPAEKEAPSTAPVSASAAASAAEAPSSDELCFKKTDHGCCEDVPVKAKPNAKTCPGGTVRKNKCKGFGRNCLPNPVNADGTRDKTRAR